MKPKYQIGDTIECEAIIGWVRVIYILMMEDATKEVKQPQFVYAIEEPESEQIFYYSEEEVSR